MILYAGQINYFFFTLQILLSEEYTYYHMAYIVTDVPGASKPLLSCPNVERKGFKVFINWG